MKVIFMTANTNTYFFTTFFTSFLTFFPLNFDSVGCNATAMITSSTSAILMKFIV